MQVVDEGGVVPVRVLNPNARLAASGGASFQRRLEERINLLAGLRTERDVCRRRERLPPIDREVVQPIGPVMHAVVLHVKFAVPQRCEGGRVEATARIEVLHDEQDVIDDDAPDRYTRSSLLFLFIRSPSGSMRRVAGIDLPEAARQLLVSDAVAHVVTIDEDGTPHITLAWVGLEDDEIVLATMPEQRKLRNLRRDPRIAVSVPSTTTNEWGLLEYLVVYGTARVTEGGAAEMLQRLAHTYIGPGVVFPNVPDPPPGFVTRITPQRLGGVGPWNPPPG